jgi:hypothetical protein
MAAFTRRDRHPRRRRGQPALSEMKFNLVDLDLIEERGRELKTRFAYIFE